MKGWRDACIVERGGARDSMAMIGLREGYILPTRAMWISGCHLKPCWEEWSLSPLRATRVSILAA